MKSNAINVLYYIPGFRYGGIESTTLNICKYAQDYPDINIDLLVEKQDVKVDFDLFHKYGCKIHQISPMDFFRPWLAIRYYNEIDEIIRNGNYDIIHSVSPERSPFVFRSAKQNGITVRMLHARTSQLDGPRTTIAVKSALMQRSRQMATHYFACSQEAGKLFFGRHPFTILPNSIESEKFVFNNAVRIKLRKELGICDDNLLFGHIGRFCQAKNHPFLIDVFTEIYKLNNNARFILIGDGPLLESVQKMISQRGLKEVTIFAGRVSNVSDYYMAMDMLIYPSLYEGFPNVVTEAQGTGLKIIASDRITKAVKMTDLLEFHSLEESSKMWADNAIMRAGNYARQDMKEIIKAAGYDAYENALSLFELYRKLRLQKSGELI